MSRVLLSILTCRRRSNRGEGGGWRRGVGGGCCGGEGGLPHLLPPCICIGVQLWSWGGVPIEHNSAAKNLTLWSKSDFWMQGPLSQVCANLSPDYIYINLSAKAKLIYIWFGMLVSLQNMTQQVGFDRSKLYIYKVSVYTNLLCLLL